MPDFQGGSDFEVIFGATWVYPPHVGWHPPGARDGVLSVASAHWQACRELASVKRWWVSV